MLTNIIKLTVIHMNFASIYQYYILVEKLNVDAALAVYEYITQVDLAESNQDIQ